MTAVPRRRSIVGHQTVVRLSRRRSQLSQQGSEVRRKPIGLLNALPLAGSVLFAALYGLLRPAYEQFYEPLGVSPDQLGLTELAIVAHTAGYACALLMLLTAGLLALNIGFRLIVAMFEALRRTNAVAVVEISMARISNYYERHKISFVFGVIAFGGVFIAIVGALYLYDLRALLGEDKPRRLHGNAQAAVGLILEFFILGLVGGLPYGISNSRRLDNLAARARRITFRSLVLVLLAISATFAVDFWHKSSELGQDLLHNRAPGRESSALYFLGVSDAPAQILPLGASDPLGICDGLKVPYLLGEDSSFAYVIVYPQDHANVMGVVYRLPLETYSVARGLSSPEPCSPPKK